MNNISEEDIIKEMMKAGLHFGHKQTFNHPKASYFIVKSYDVISGIDLKETLRALQTALDFIKEIVGKEGKILFVGTTAGAKQLIKELAQKYNYPYVNERWLGGTLTNFKTLAQRIKDLKNLEEQQKSGAWEKYTKKEKLQLEKELSQLQKKFAGIRTLEKLPQAIFIVDTGLNKIAVREAKLLNIPIIGILDTDDDPTIINYPIPANDSAKSSIKYILEKVDEAINEGMKNMASPEINK
ncbi:MAG: 30S ribosomal protein S2 [Parcubacteria group bacterium]|nr:30S ribosomal protein S2 [Parcubacteria group bacterium]